jgi:arginase
MNISVICVPYQLDVARWGFALGPQAFLDAGLVARIEARGHRVSDPVWIDLPRDERTRDTVTNLSRLAARTSEAVTQALQQQDAFAVVLEGDCTHAVGAIGGVARACGVPGVVWFDAHGDLHTYATTGTGFIGGMPYAVALGWDLRDWREAAGLAQPVRHEAAALIGASDLDPEESAALDTHGIARLDAEQIDDTGSTTRTLLAPRATQADAWYLHFDVDVGRTRRSARRDDAGTTLASAHQLDRVAPRGSANGAAPRHIACCLQPVRRPRTARRMVRIGCAGCGAGWNTASSTALKSMSFHCNVQFLAVSTAS